jgi:nicotinate dehydrogenase subunit B
MSDQPVAPADDPSGRSTLNKDQIAERGARTTPHGAETAPWGPRLRTARRPQGGVPTVRGVHGGVPCREHVTEEQRSQPGCPAREVVLDQRGQATSIELERYELFEGARYRFELDRRDFAKTFGAGLLVLLVARRLDAQESGRRGGFGGDRMPSDVGAWLHIGDDGRVTAFTGKTEIGQNIRTSLTQAVAEELGAPIPSISLVMADTAKTPFDMGTFGSRTTPTMNLQLRKVAAAARAVLVDRAAARWNTTAAAVTVKDGRVHKSATESMGFGDLVKGTPLVATVTDTTPLKPAKEWSVAGTRVMKIDGRDFVTGRHRYTSDMTREGMLHGKVVRPPAYGATLVKADTSAAEAMKGVVVVRDGTFLGVAAPTMEAAAAAAAAIKAEWTAGSGASARTLFADLKTKLERDGPPGPDASIDSAIQRAAAAIDAQYTIAYIAHAPLEPRAAVAEWQGDAVTVWTGTQRPFGVQQELADAFRVPADRVRVVVPDTGSAYGGKHTGETAVEAARLARAAKKPVKLVWSREEEFAWAYFRPAGVIDVRAAVGGDGTLVAWDYHNYNSGSSGLQTPYAVAAKREAFHSSQSPLRQGSYRGLAATANHFARESHMDDLARAAKLDPLAFRLKNLKDERIANVLKAAAEKFGWNGRARNAPTDDAGRRFTGQKRGCGLACGVEKGGYTATCVELDVDGSAITLRRIVVAFECGAIVNPDGLDNQVSGAVVQGLGGALFEAIEFDNGKLVNGRFATYRLPRFSDVPPIEVVLVNRPDLPSAGSGETPIVGIAPAIGNAILDASGVRIRSMPLIPRGIPAATHEV